MSVERAMDEIGSAEFAMWRAILLRNPGGPSRDNDHMAQLAVCIRSLERTVAACNGVALRTREPKAEDFRLRYLTADEAAAEADKRRKMQSLVANAEMRRAAQAATRTTKVSTNGN